MSKGPTPLAPITRLMRRVAIDEGSGCWLWQGATSAKSGYGRIRVGSRLDDSVKTVQAHRLSYELHVGPIPEGLDLDHLCRNRACVNPDHLEPVTHIVNCHRGDSAPQATCYRDHSEARQTFHNGIRRCLDCQTIRQEKYKAKRHGV